MRERDYYPAGAYDDPSAPYNEISIPERDFDIEVCESVRKNVTITTSNYNPIIDDEDGHVYADTENVDWEDEYEMQYMDIPTLLQKMRELLEKWKPTEMTRTERNLFKRVMHESDGWEEDYIEVHE